jgi:hypothetical protein
MKKECVIYNTPDFKGWESCFRYFMERSDTFSIIFQGDIHDTRAEGLNIGKKEFLDLPSVTISPYGGMKDSFMITGELTQAAQDLFLNFVAPSFEGYTSDLWSFQFLKGNIVTISVEDFSEAFFVLDESELEDLSSRGVDTKTLDEDSIPSASTEEFSAKTAFSKRNMSELDESNLNALEDLSAALKKAFLPKTTS